MTSETLSLEISKPTILPGITKNAYGHCIYNFLQNATLHVIFSDAPTRFNDSSSRTMDFGHFNEFNYAKDMGYFTELKPDHFPIKINIQIRTSPVPPKIIDRVNWAQFQRNINDIHTSYRKLAAVKIFKYLWLLFDQKLRTLLQMLLLKYINHGSYEVDPKFTV